MRKQMTQMRKQESACDDSSTPPPPPPPPPPNIFRRLEAMLRRLDSLDMTDYSLRKKCK